MKEREHQQNQAARRHAEADVNTTADVEGAAAAMHEAERQSPAGVASQARAAQEAKAAAEGKNGDKDTATAPAERPGNFTGEAVNLTTDTPPDEEATENSDDTQARSDTIASRIHADNEFRNEQERDRDVDENINTDPAALEETGEVYSPPGPSISREE